MLRNNVHSTFQAEKIFELTPNGPAGRGSRAPPTAQTRALLQSVSTPVRGIPCDRWPVGRRVRAASNTPGAALAERQVRRKVEARVLAQIDREADERIALANKQLKSSVLIPLANLSLEPSVASMQTSVDRLTMRLRIACPDQLGAHTPRPRAPSGSLASIQVHESAVNNFIEQLDLTGRTFSQAALYEWIMAKLNRSGDKPPAGLRDDVFLRFADEDCVRLRAQDGRIELTLAFAELRAEGEVYRNFTVRVYYRPEEDNHQVQLARDGVVQLIGTRLGTRGQVALRGIFSKAFPRERRFNILPEKLTSDPRLAGVEVAQLVIDDGWLGLALADGPDSGRVATRPRTTTQP